MILEAVVAARSYATIHNDEEFEDLQDAVRAKRASSQTADMVPQIDD